MKIEDSDITTGSLWIENSNGATSIIRVDDYDGAYAYCTEIVGAHVGTRWAQLRVQPGWFGRTYKPFGQDFGQVTNNA